jgi:hypothetical protein
MKKKMTLQKATVAAGVVAMSVGLFNSFDVEADGGCSYVCCQSKSTGCVDRDGVEFPNDYVYFGTFCP